MSNLAELGYFEDLLLDAGIEVRLVDDDNFDTLHGVWRGAYGIWVRSCDAARGADLVEHQLETADSREALGHCAAPTEISPSTPRSLRYPMGEFDQQQSGKSLGWSPLIVCLLAGGMVYWGGQSLMTVVRPPAAGDASPDLAKALESLDQPVEFPLGQPPARAILRGNGRGSLWLQEDLDGDGRFDRIREFRDGRLVAGPDPGAAVE